MKSIKQVLRLAAGLAILSIILSYLYHSCPITFKKDMEIGDVVTLLLNFGVIAILVERFATQFLLRDHYVEYMSAMKIKGYPTFKPKGLIGINNVPMTVLDEEEESKKEFKQKLFWISWGVGMVIASIGFRFFYNVTDVPACMVDYHKPLYVISDVFMTGVLLSGGSALVLEIITWWKGEE